MPLERVMLISGLEHQKFALGSLSSPGSPPQQGDMDRIPARNVSSTAAIA